jgi:hypothetical protein
MNTTIQRHLTHLKLGAGALACVAAGAGASAIANAGAATPSSTAHATRPGAVARPAGGAMRLRALARRTVEGQFVVATKSGTFQTVDVARGTVQSISGQQLTLVEGTRTATYKTVTLTLPGTTTVRDDGAASSLGQVSDGQRAIVIEGPNRAVVIARTPASGS